MRWPWAVLAVLALALAGCAQDSSSPRRPPTLGQQLWANQTFGTLSDVVGQTAYTLRWSASTGSGWVGAVDIRSGEPGWTVPTHRLDQAPIVQDGVVLLAGTYSGSLVAVDADDGSLLWHTSRTREGGGATLLGVIVADGLVIVGGDNITALDLHTGAHRWTKPVAGGPVASHGSLVYASTMDDGPGAHLFALDAATGDEVWRSGLARRYAFAAGEECVAFGLWPDGAECLDPRTGRQRWQVPLPRPLGGSLVAGGLVVMGSQQEAGTRVGVLTALDADTGAVAWTATQPGWVVSGALWVGPVLERGLVVAATPEAIYAFHAEDGRLAWTQPGGAMRLVAGDGVLLAQVSGKGVVAYSLR